MHKSFTRTSAILLAIVAAGCARHSGNVAPTVVVASPPAFETRLEIATDSGTHADYWLGDFDADGTLDMAVISLTGELRILIGGNTTFNVGQQQQIDGLPIWMSGGDFDRDGDEDLVIVRSDANQVTIWLNDGAAGFSEGASIAAGAGALALAVGDLNGDDFLDVAISRPAAPQVVVGFGDGAGGFASQQQLGLPGGGTAFNLAIGRVDADNVDDLIVVDTGMSRLLVFAGGPALSPTDICELQVPGTPGAVTFGDLSGDGGQDLVVSAFANFEYVVITDITFPATISGLTVCNYQSFSIPVPHRPSLAKVGDVTGDGINDLVACMAWNASICIAPGTATGGIGDLELLDATGLPLRPHIADFDGNGQNDIFTLSGLDDRINLWLARDSGAIAGARSHESGLPGASWLEGADFDGDGDVEVICGSDADSRLSILGGNGRLDPEFSFDVGMTVHQLKAGDLDLDGLPDLVVGVPGGIKVLRNASTPGNYQFDLLPATPMTIGSGNHPFGITIGDFDRDGFNDIAMCDFTGGGVHITPGTATPFAFGPEQVINVGGGPVDIVSANFVGDSQLDFAVSRASDSVISILRNDGNNQYVQVLEVPVGQSPNYLVASDFNRDNFADLVVSNAVSDTVTVLFGNGTGFVGNDYPAGAAPTALMAQDLTGDGIDDILVASLQSGDFRVLVGDGDGGFPTIPSFPGTLGASDVVLQDMTGDGRPDLLVSSLVSDRVSFVRNIRE